MFYKPGEFDPVLKELEQLEKQITVIVDSVEDYKKGRIQAAVRSIQKAREALEESKRHLAKAERLTRCHLD